MKSSQKSTLGMFIIIIVVLFALGNWMVKGIATVFTGEAFRGNPGTLLLLLGLVVCTVIALMVAWHTELLIMAFVAMFIAIFPAIIPTALLPNVSSQAITVLSPVLCDHPYVYGDVATSVRKGKTRIRRHSLDIDQEWITDHQLICYRPDGSTQLVSTNKVQIWWYTISWIFFTLAMFTLGAPLFREKPSAAKGNLAVEDSAQDET